MAIRLLRLPPGWLLLYGDTTHLRRRVPLLAPLRACRVAFRDTISYAYCCVLRFGVAKELRAASNGVTNKRSVACLLI